MRRLIKPIVLGCVVLVVFAPIAFFAAVRWLPYPAAELEPPASSTTLTDRNGNTIAQFPAENGNWYEPLSGGQISPFLLEAIVAVEDQRFYQHGGVDWKSAASAVWQDLTAWRYVRGASTLTMQLEHLRQPASRGLGTKLIQAIRAIQIEEKQTKQQILVEYLNRAPMGGNLTGAGAASLRYFGKKCADLSLGQAALLAGIPQSPVRLRPDRYPDVALARRDHVLERMFACGMITQEQRTQAATEPINAGWLPLPQEMPEAAPLLPTLMRLAKQSPKQSTGEVIHTTIDPAIQRLVSRQLPGKMAAAIVVVDNIKSQCVAAASWGDLAEDDLTVVAQPVGSILQPVVYACAFDAGICTPQTIVDDAMLIGPMPAGVMLSQSGNISNQKLLSDPKIGELLGEMRGDGKTTTPMRLAESYAILARGGVRRGIALTAEAVSPVGEGVLHRWSCLQVLQCVAGIARTKSICPASIDLAPAWVADQNWGVAVTPKYTVVVWLAAGQNSTAQLALRIISEIEPANGNDAAAFAPPVDALTSAQPASVRLDAADLTLLSPINHQHIAIDQARIPLRARLSNASKDDFVWWLIDGQCLGSCPSDDQFWWQPTAGPHEVRVIDAAGQTQTVTVQVGETSH